MIFITVHNPFDMLSVRGLGGIEISRITGFRLVMRAIEVPAHHRQPGRFLTPELTANVDFLAD